jgi:hypothetical protein
MFTKILIANRGEIACRVIARRQRTDARFPLAPPCGERADMLQGDYRARFPLAPPCGERAG